MGGTWARRCFSVSAPTWATARPRSRAPSGGSPRGGFRVTRRSSLWLTEPVGGPPQGWFLNAVAEGETALRPEALLEACLATEREMGRVRAERNGPRTIDVDVLLFGDERCSSPGLVIPHPRLHERRFVLEPLAEIAPGLRPPRARPHRARAARPLPGRLRGPAPRARGGAGLMAFHYIAIDGPIGAGKTTVVDKLAERLDANKVLEDWATNPFLRAFYDGKPGVAFQAELFFLLSRYRQQQELTQRQLFTQATLSDYVFEKSRLFAYLNLDDSELLIFDKLFSLLSESVPKPDLVVYLQAPTEVLMKRVKARGRPEETSFSEEYLAEVNRAYNHYFFHYSATPLLVVNTADVDFVKNPEDTDDLLKQIRGMGKGTQYYVPRSRA